MFKDDDMSAHYLKHWPINQSWHCWESFETKDTKRCIIAQFERCSCKLKMMRTCLNQGRYMVHSNAIWNDVLEVGTTEKNLIASTQNGAFWRYLKWCFGSWYYLEHFESKKASWCIRTLFKRWFGSWNCLENIESTGTKWYILALFERWFGSGNCLEHFESKEANSA